MFILDNEGWMEPLQITNLLALSRGIIQLPEGECDANRRDKLAMQEYSDGADSTAMYQSIANEESNACASVGAL
jgi:hypothetical protein